MNTVYFHSDDTISFPIVEGISVHALNEDAFYTLELLKKVLLQLIYGI